MSTASALANTSGTQASEQNTYLFLLGWFLMIIILVLVNKSRLGHVIIYYALLLIIFFLLVTEYRQLAPLLSSIQSIAEFNQVNKA